MLQKHPGSGCVEVDEGPARRQPKLFSGWHLPILDQPNPTSVGTNSDFRLLTGWVQINLTHLYPQFLCFLSFSLVHKFFQATNHKEILKEKTSTASSWLMKCENDGPRLTLRWARGPIRVALVWANRSDLSQEREVGQFCYLACV